MEQEKEKILDLRTVMLILLVCAFGFLAVNQGFKFFYNAHLLKNPCDLCVELNPELTGCIYQRTAVYPDGMGGWTNETPFRSKIDPLIKP